MDKRYEVYYFARTTSTRPNERRANTSGPARPPSVRTPLAGTARSLTEKSTKSSTTNSPGCGQSRPLDRNRKKGGDESMDLGVVYLEHCLADPDFYDSLQDRDDSASRFALADEHGMASLALWLFLPSAPVLCARDPSKVETIPGGIHAVVRRHGKLRRRHPTRLAPQADPRRRPGLGRSQVTGAGRLLEHPAGRTF